LLAGLSALGIGAGLLARRRAGAVPRLLGVVEPGKVRRRRARARLRERATAPLHRLRPTAPLRRLRATARRASRRR
jgi:hypothetical protein